MQPEDNEGKTLTSGQLWELWKRDSLVEEPAGRRLPEKRLRRKLASTIGNVARRIGKELALTFNFPPPPSF